MTHPIHRVSDFAVVAPYTQQVSFADGTEQRIDSRPVLQGPLFGALRGLHTFNEVGSATGGRRRQDGIQSRRAMARLPIPTSFLRAIAVAAAGVFAAFAPAPAQTGAALPPRVEAVYRALDARFREQIAMDADLGLPLISVYR